MSSDSGSSISAGEDQHLAIDQRQQVLQAEQEGTQKRTFSNWINSQLTKHPQQSIIKELYADFQDGNILLDLLEVLSGEVLPREKGKNLFQQRSNIESALNFLGNRSIKLINIHVEDIISGKPSIVLGLIWQIILHFHIEGLASILSASEDPQPVESEAKTPTASPSPKRSAKSRWKISAKKVLLHWAQEQCARVGSINVTDFKSSWKNGQAFLAIINSLRPDLVDMEKFRLKSNEEKLREAFRIAEDELKIPRLLEPEDVNVADPDEKSIMTYVAQFLQYSKNRADPSRDTTDQVRKAMEWLNLEEQTLKKLFSEMQDETYTKKYQEILLFMRRFNEQKRIYMSDLAVETLQSEEQRLIKQSLENITFQIAQWKEQLDRSLPPPLDAIESWLSEVENLMVQTLPESGSHHNAMTLLQTLSVSFKALMNHAASHSESLRSFRNVDDNGVILVPADKMEEMKTRMEKILTANFSVLLDYRLSGHFVLALLEEGRPKLKVWKGKYKSQEAVESLLVDYNEFVVEKQSMIHLENAFHKFKELHNQLLTAEEHSDDPEIAKQYKVIESKYETFVSSTLEAKSVLEKVLTCWIQIENNISLITAWLDEQHKIPPGHVPMEILSKWKSVHKSLNRDGSFLIEKTNEKAASKLSHRLKSFNNQWAKYLKLYEGKRKVGNGSDVHENPSDGTHEVDSTNQTPVSAQTLRLQIQTLQKNAKSAESVQACTDILSHLEKLEKLTESVNVWAVGAEQVLAGVQPQQPLEESVINTIQDFYDNGISHQEDIAEAELTVQAVDHLILGHEDLKHFNVIGLQKNLIQANEKVQEFLSRLGFALHPPEKPLPEKEIKMNFEGSKQDLENYITSAMTLLGQKVTPEEFISQYEKTVGKFSIQNLEKFLQAADQMRAILSDKEKLAVDAVSADLRHRWKIVHDELESYVSELKQFVPQLRSDDHSSNPKAQVSQAVHQNGDSTTEVTETNGSSPDRQLQIYEAQKRDLEIILQRAKDILVAESPREAQDVHELQIRRQELQALQAQLGKSWRRLESTSDAVEKLMEGDHKKKFSEAKSSLQSGVEEVTEEMKTRIQSLTITINILLPIEKEVSVLCEASLQTPTQVMEKFTVSSIGTVYENIQEFQSLVEDQIQCCDDLESAAEFVEPASPIDGQAVQSIVQQYKVQLEATSEATKEREAILKDLEAFLHSLTTTKWSIQAVVAVTDMDRTTVLQKQRNIELFEQEVHRLRMKAKELDDQLVPAEIHLEDPESGYETTCQKLVEPFFVKIEIAKQTVLQDLGNLDSRDSGIPQLNGASNSHLLSDDDTASGLNDHHQEQEMETFTASTIGSVLREIKEVQNTFENEIQQCDTLDLSDTESNLDQYKLELEATNKVMRERQATLKALEDFLSSLKVAKSSMESESAELVKDKKTLLEKQRNLEELEKDIYRLGQEAEKLDDNLQSAQITMEDPECGGATSCQEMISMFFDKLEFARQTVLRELQNLQENEALENLYKRQRALCKHIEDIQDEVDKIGLRDPTIHAVQQRMKSLEQLEKKLESLRDEKTLISNGFMEHLQTTSSNDIHQPEECEMLWEDVVLNISHSQEHCEVVIKLLREFQSNNKELTSLIQKAEALIPCQSSYMGKENLKKILEKVTSVKQEFDEHSEDVEEISSICKKLHFQINQIKSFEESPFQIEANTIIDKWLDMTEKIECYHENLKSVNGLWSKILNLSEDIEHWSEIRKNVFEISDITRENALELNVEAENQEKHLAEIYKLSREIQNLLQTDELPLELQVIQSSLQNKITMLSKFASAKLDILEQSPVPPVTCSTKGKLEQNNALPAEDLSMYVNGGAEAEGNHGAEGEETQNRWEDSTDLTSDLHRFKSQPDSGPDVSEGQQSEQLRTLHVNLSELKERCDSLNTDLQPGQQEKKSQLASFSLLLQEGQELTGAEMMAAGYDGSSLGQNSQWLEFARLHEDFMRKIQDTVQILEARIEEQHHYDSLSSALNNKMTSFSEELFNFARSSRESAPCEQKRHKLQELRNQYEVLQKDQAEVNQVAEAVKQSTSSPGVKRIEAAVEMDCCKLRSCLERLDYLVDAIEQPPLLVKSKKKKPKKAATKKTGSQSTLEPSSPPPLQLHEKHIGPPIEEHEVGKAAIEPSVKVTVERSRPVAEPSVHLDVELPEQISDHFADELDLTMKPVEIPLTQPTAEQPLLPEECSSVQCVEQFSVEPLVQPAEENCTHPASKSSMINVARHSLQPAPEPSAQPVGESSMQLAEEFSVLPVAGPITHPSGESSVQHSFSPTELTAAMSTIQPDANSLMQPTEESFVVSGSSPSVKPPSEPSVPHVSRVLIHSSKGPAEGSSEIDHSTKTTIQTEKEHLKTGTSQVQPVVEVSGPSENLTLPLTFQSADKISTHVEEPYNHNVAGSLQPTVELSEQSPLQDKSKKKKPKKVAKKKAGSKSTSGPTTQPFLKHVRFSEETSGKIAVETSVMSEANMEAETSVEPSVHLNVEYVPIECESKVDLAVKPAEFVSVQLTAELPLKPEKDSSVQCDEQSSAESLVEEVLTHPEAKSSIVTVANHSLQAAPELDGDLNLRPEDLLSALTADELSVLHDTVSSVQLPAESSVVPAAPIIPPMQPILGPSLSITVDPSLPLEVKVLRPSKDRTLQPTIQSAENGEPFSQNVTGPSKPKVKPNKLSPNDTSVDVSIQQLANFSKQDKIQIEETSEQDAYNHAAHVLVESVVSSVLEQEVQDSVILGAQEVAESSVTDSVQLQVQNKEDQIRPNLKESAPPADQPLAQPSKTDKAKEKESKGRKKKKIIAADKPAVNGVPSPVQEPTSVDHSEEDLSAEFVQKKINEDAADTLRDVAEVKTVEECAEATKEQREAIGQLEMRLDDCDSFRRQLQTSLSDSPAHSDDSLHVSGLLNTVEERLRQAKMVSDDGGRVVILNEVQMRDTKLASEQPNPLISEGASAILSKSGDKESETALEEPLPEYPHFQQQMQEILSNILHIGEVKGTGTTFETFTSQLKPLCVSKADPDQSPEGTRMATMERTIRAFKNHPVKLNVTELEKQLEDIEKLHNDISQKGTQESAVQKAEDGDSRGSELLLSKCEDLLNELTILRTEKRTLCQTLKSFQDALCAARQAYQMLCKEKENLKMAPTESHTSQLDKIAHFLNKVEKEKTCLHVLKAEQANICLLGLSSKDKDSMDTEVSQIEDLWEQIELGTYKERDRLAKEAEELEALKGNMDDVQSIIQVQQDLLDQPTPSPEDILNASLGLSAETQSIKHWFYMLRNKYDLQMKRTWGGNERQDLENSLESLKNELENLEERVQDRQLTRCQTPDTFLQQYPALKPIYRLFLWVKKSQDKSSSEKSVALFWGDVEQQTETYRKIHRELLDRKSSVDSIIEESKHISVNFDDAMSKDFTSFLQQLQELYQEQIMQSTLRLQQLELGWEKRKTLFSEIEKLKELLQCLEKEATPVKRGIFTATELCEQLNYLKAKTTEMEEIEGLALTLLRNSQSYHGELKSSEQLYLNDILRSLKSKARRIRRLEEKTFCYTKKLQSICNDFQERLTSFHRNMNALQPVEPKMPKELSEQDGEVFEKNLQLFQNAVSSSEDHLFQILRYKDLFEDNRLHWDDLTIDNLQKSFLSLTEGRGHSESCGQEQGHYQKLSEKITAMFCSLQKDFDTVDDNFNVITAHVLSKKIQKIGVLITEELAWLNSEQGISVESLDAEVQSLTGLKENIDRSHQAFNQLITDYYKRPEQSQHQLKQTLYTLSQIDKELQEPFVTELHENELEERLLRLEALGDISKAEMEALSSMSSLPFSDDFRELLLEAEKTSQKIDERLSERISLTKETANILQHVQKAITSIAELFRQYEEKLNADPLALRNLRKKADILDSEKELNLAIAEIQSFVSQLKPVCNIENQKALDAILNQIGNKNNELAGLRERNDFLQASYEEKYQFFESKKQKILQGLEEVDAVIRESFLLKPASYKSALEQWEKSKILMARIHSYEEELLELEQISRDLGTINKKDVQLLEKMVSSLWDRWLYLLGISRDFELYCDELKQEWKFISELLEREVIILDNWQEEVLDKPDIRQRTSHLQSALAEIQHFKENVQLQLMELSLLQHRIENILGTQDSSAESVPVIQEIESMKTKCEGLLHKVQKNTQEIKVELDAREAMKEDISAVKLSVREVSSRLENMEFADVNDTKIFLEELLKLVGPEKEKAQVIMEKLQEQYAEMIPGDLQSEAEHCQEYLQETEEKIRNEIEQCLPQNVLTRKVNEILAGLKNIEAQLSVKTETIDQAKELQKKVWDDVDVWHSKLHALESEVQDIAEEDPCLAQEWMDKLTEPFNYYQQVNCLAERRTANLNKVASKLEEYEDTLKSTKLWIKNTNGLLNEEMKDCSAKVLHKHFNALAIALDDSDSKQILLDTIGSELGELAVIVDTNKIVQSLGEVMSQVKNLQQRILHVLPQIQHLANEIASIENEVKKMEKRVASIRTILMSSDIDEMSPKQHHEHGQVILENIHSIRGTVADIEAYRPHLPLSASGIFRRMGRLLREAEVLEKVTMQQNKLLEPILGEMLELEQEQEKLRHFTKSSAYESPDTKVRAEELRKHMDILNHKKEEVLLSQRSSVKEHLLRLQQEPEEQDLDALLSPITEGVDSRSNEMHWTDPCALPSLVEEQEDSSLITEASNKVAVVGESADLDVKAKENANSFYTSPIPLHQMTQEQREDVSTESGSVKPEMILRDCQGKVTEVELWLQRVNLSLAESKQQPDMLQSLEQKLVDFQKTLQETEKKINSLLEGADHKRRGPGSLLEEAETLSRKLNALKGNLENIQGMLQVKPNVDQEINTEAAEHKSPTEMPIPHQEALETLQTRNAAGEVVSGQTRPRSKSYPSEDITWSKWQYLQKELSQRTKAAPLSHSNEPEAEREVRINFVSRFPGRAMRPLSTEDSKQFLPRLQALYEEAAVPLPQESEINVPSALFDWLFSVFQWLQKVDEVLESDVSREEASSEMTRYDKLSEDLNSLSDEMNRKKDSLLKLVSYKGENVAVLSQCYNDIRNWLVHTHSVVASKTKQMDEELNKHNNYQNDIRKVYEVLVKKKTILQQLGSKSNCQAAELLKESVVCETELHNLESQVALLSEKGERLSIPSSSNQEIHKLQDVLDETWRALRVKQNEYSSAVIAKSQFESLLCGVTHLTLFGKEKLVKSNNYKCASKEELNSHIQKHKNFFNTLDSQNLLLQALPAKRSLPADVMQVAETAVCDANVLGKEADAHGIQLMAILKEWDEFSSRYDDLNKKMEALESLVPTKSLVEESEERVKERLHQYQNIKAHLDENESRLNWMALPGKRLQPLVRCGDLDSQVLGMEGQWVRLTQKVSHELHRLESLGSRLASFNTDSSELSAWMTSAFQKLKNFRTQSLDVSQDLDTIKDNLHKFFEFTLEVDEKSSLKTSVLNAGAQLLRLKEADPAMLKLSLAKYEEQWAEIIASLPPIQEKLQQLLMEKLPSLQAIQELMDWMKDVEQSTIEALPTATSDIRSLLQKYKTLRKEMSYKQCIVDFVNQSLLQLSVGDVERKRYQRTELAELLGTLNLQWSVLQGHLNRRIQHIKQTLEFISDQESRRQSVNNWFDAQQVRLNKLQKPSSVTAAESVLAECSDLEEQIKAKSSVLEELARISVPSEDHNVFQDGVLTSENLLKKRDALTSQVMDLRTTIHSLLKYWNMYNENYQFVNKMSIKLVCVLSQYQRPISSLICLKHQMKILKSAQEEAEQHEGNWSNIRAALKSMEGLCSPSVFAILGQNCTEAESIWTSVHEELSSHLQSAGLLLQLWETYTESYQNHSRDMEQLEVNCQQFLYAKLSEDRLAETLQQRIQDLQELEKSLQVLRARNLQVSELADKVIQLNVAASDVIHSERQNTSHRIDYLERSVASKTAELKLIQNEVNSFKNTLEKLQTHVKSSADVVGHVCLSQKEKEERSELIKKHLLDLRKLTVDMEHLNEETFTLPLDDNSLMLLQNLNRSWEKTGEMALEDCREHQVRELDRKSFIQNYETWMQCMEEMENNLTVGIAGTFEALKKQQEMYEKMQAEIAINEHILPSFVNKTLSVLESEKEDYRCEVILKLTSLKEKWQSVISLVQQRNREINVLLQQWWHFNVSKQKLGVNLSAVQAALSIVAPQKCHSLINATKLLYDFKEKERHLKRLEPTYNTAVENCKDLLAVADPETKEALQRDLTLLQDLWQDTTRQLQTALTHLNALVLKRENFEGSVEDRRKTLHGLKVRVDEPLPTLHEDLQRFKLTLKELEEALDEWGDSLKELDNMKAELSQYIIAEDGVVLKKQVEALHRQWEELCLRVSMRRQEIEDRLNAWNVFNEKNKELCDWLTQMESKVLQTADVNIEEMIEKLQKDCMEEINLFSENKLHLKQIGEQLIIASNKARSTDIENKLNKVNDRWKHLFDVIGSRVKKLKETLVIIQQLDKNMSNLRTWLSRIESELSKPVIYSICDDQEISKKLEEQKDLQKDIELHSAGVASVLNICERLLHDTDACANETECDSIQQTTRSLDKRWRNICTMSMERRLRIEETWRLWQKFLEDYSKFDDWLREAEAMAASPDLSDVLYTKAKEEQKKFEAFQRQIHERLTHLELINKQYRRLARENRTDAASRLKQMVHEGNQRWDRLQRRVSAILRRMKHFTSQREDFEGTRDSILVWLTEMDLQLTNVEHFSESDIAEKMQQLIGFKQEITLNTNKIDQLIVFGEQLIQKSEAMDAVVIEDELEEIHRYCQEVFGRVYRFHERLTSKGLNLEEERETSENDTDGEDSREIQNSSWHSTIPEVDTTHPSLCHLMPPPLPHERSGRETPVSVDSIPLEWDPTVDVGGSSMHENEEESSYYNPLSGKSDLETPLWHSPDKHMAADYNRSETSQERRSSTAFLDVNSQQTSTPSRETDVRTSGTTNEQLEERGLRGLYSPGTHSGVIERWEIIQAQSLSDELSTKQNLQQWQQLNSDLENISLWLERTEVELDNAEKLKPSTSIQELERRIKRFKDTAKTFDHYKALVLAANLRSKEFQQEDDGESRSLLSRLHEVNSRWDQACQRRDQWRERLQNDLNQCEEFHETSHQLLLWLTEAESQRLKYQASHHKRDPSALLECQRQLLHLKEQLLARQTQANSLHNLSSHLLESNAGEAYVEANERTHVIATKMRQLLKEVSRDLRTAQRALDDCRSDVVDSATEDSQAAVGASPQDTRTQEPAAPVQEAPKKRSFLYRVLRAALPLQLLLLLLLLLACMIPFSEEDYSCAQANNFARSFYPMLRYTNGPPPT